MNEPISSTQRSDVSPSASSSGTGVLSVLSLLESLTLAIALALIIRGFVVEAFVIPTGSMAESLMGTHTETICATCRYTYTTGLPLRPGSNSIDPRAQGRPLTCPNCGNMSLRYAGGVTPRRNGDRVLVLKPMYFLSRYKPLSWLAPKRWDVVVFLYPGSGTENYIKRLTGLPGETIEVIDGDVYIDGRIARKPPRAQQGLWIPLFDNDYQRPTPGQGWPRWQAQNGSSYLETFHRGRLLRITADANECFVTYTGPVNGTLTYNSLTPSVKPLPVADLRLSFDVISADLGPTAQFAAVLSKGDDYFRLRLDFSDSASPYLELQHARGLPSGSGHSQWRTVREDGRPLRYDLPSVVLGKSMGLALRNVDYQVSIWLDGQEVLATSDKSYSPGSIGQARLLAMDEGSSSPRVYISARDCRLDLSHLKLDRDVYYTSKGLARAPSAPQSLHASDQPFRIPSDRHPAGAAYFMMGDNSSHSFDSRLWSAKHHGLNDDYVRGTVPRDHVFGQAFFVYWPAAGPLVGRQLPLVPRVGKMRLIR